MRKEKLKIYMIKKDTMTSKKPTIYEALKEKLGREPTNKELKSEVDRILTESMIERKSKVKTK